MPVLPDPMMSNEPDPQDIIEPRPLGMDGSMLANEEEPLPPLNLEDDEEPLPMLDLNDPAFAVAQPRETIGPVQADSPSMMAGVGNWFGTRMERAEANWQYQNEENHAMFQLGRALFRNDDAGMEQAMKDIEGIAPPPEDQSWVDQGVSLAMAIPNTMFEGDRLTAAGDSLEKLAPATVASPFLNIPIAAIGASGQYDAHVITGLVASTLIKEGVDPQIAKGVALTSGLTGSAMGWVGLGKLAQAMPAMRRKIIREALGGTLKELRDKGLTKAAMASKALSATAEAGEAAIVGALTMGAIEADKVAMTNLGRAISNNVDQTEIPLDTIPHAVLMVYQGMKSGAILGAGAHVAFSGIGASLGKLENMRKEFVTRPESVIGRIKTAEERSARDLTVANKDESVIEVRPDDGGINERLSFEEDAYRNTVADELVKVADEDLDLVIERKVLTRSGKESDISIPELRVKQKAAAALRKEIYGKEEVVFEPVEPNPNAPVREGVPPGIEQRKKEAIAKEKELKKAGQTPKDPERAAAITEVKVLRSLSKAKKAELKELDFALRMHTDPTVTRAEEALIRGDLALRKAQELAEPGWLEPALDVPEMTAESNREFRDQVIEVRKQMKKAESAGDANGVARGKAAVRQMVDEQRRRIRVTKERNSLIGEINGLVREGARKDGKTDAETTGVMASLRAIVNMKKKDLEEVLTGQRELPTGADEGIIRGLLRIKQDKKANTIAGLQKLRDDVRDLLETGQEKRFEYILGHEMRQVTQRRVMLAEMLGENPMQQIQTKNSQIGDKLQGVPRSFQDLRNRFFDSPKIGEFITANFPGLGRIIMRDIFKPYEKSVTREIFDTTIPERVEMAGKVSDYAEMDRMISSVYGERGTMTPMELARFKHDAKYDIPKTILDNNGWPVATTDARGVQTPIRLNRFERIQMSAYLDRKGIFETYKKTHGFTEETKAAIQRLEPRDEAFKQMLLSFHDRMHGRKNSVFAPMRGYNLPKIENYSGSIVREGFDADMSLDIMLQDLMNPKPAADNITSLMKAVENSDKPIIVQNALSVLENEINDANHYMAWAQKVEDWRNTILNKEFIQGVNTRFDKQTAGEINAAIQAHVKDLARGRADFRAPGWLDFMRANAIKSSIFGKAIIGVKQLNQMMLFATEEGIGADEFMMGVAEALSDPAQTKRTMEGLSAVIKGRGLNEIDPVFSQGSMFTRPGKIDKKGLIKFYSNEFSDKYLSANISLGDRTAVYAGGYALLRHYLKTMSLEEAGLRVEAKMNETQQTSALAYQTPFQKDSSIGSRLMSTFTSGPFSSMRVVHEAVHDMFKGIDATGRAKEDLAAMISDKADPAMIAKQKELVSATRQRKNQLVAQAAKTLFIAHVMQGMAYTLMSDYGQWDNTHMAVGGALGPMAAVPAFGNFLENTLRGVAGLRKYEGEGTIVDGALAEVSTVLTGFADRPSDLLIKGAAKGFSLVSPLPLSWFTQVGFSLKDDLPEGKFLKAALILSGGTENSVEKILNEE